MGVYGYGTAGMKIPEGYLSVMVENESGEHIEREILYPANPGSIYHMTKTQDALMFYYYNKNDGVRITDLHQGIVWGTNTDNQLQAGFGSLDDRARSKRSRHVDHADLGASVGNCFLHCVEHRHAEMLLPAAPRRNTGDHPGPVLHALLSVKRTLIARDALTDNLGFFTDEYAHFVCFLTRLQRQLSVPHP